MNERSKSQPLGITLLEFSPLIWFILSILFNQIIGANLTAKAVSIFLGEIENIPDPLFSIVQPPTMLQDATDALVQSKISTRLTEEEIFDYYDRQLKRQKWIFIKEERTPYFPYFGRRNYCKNNFSATISNEQNSQYIVSLSTISVPNKICPIAMDEFFLLSNFVFFAFIFGCSITWMFYALLLGGISWGRTSDEFCYYVNRWRLTEPSDLGFPCGRFLFGKRIPLTYEYARGQSSYIFFVCLSGVIFSLYQLYFFIFGG
jgi:hypothetical protein